MNKLILYISTICIILFSSCNKDEDYKELCFETEAFNTINLFSNFNVYITEDTCFSVKFYAHEDILKNIEFNTDTMALSIYNNTENRWLTPNKNNVDVYISCNNLIRLNPHETCYIESLNTLIANELGIVFYAKANEANLNVDCNIFYYWNNYPCGGKLTVSGEANILRIWNDAIGTVDAKFLNSTTAYIENSSKGNCLITATEELKYLISSSGDIILYGNPVNIIQLNDEENENGGELIIMN